MARWLRWGSALAWIFSWRVIYLEIFRWQHMTKKLRFNPPPRPPGVDVEPQAGLPLVMVCVAAVAAPLVFVATVAVPRFGPAGRFRRVWCGHVGERS